MSLTGPAPPLYPRFQCAPAARSPGREALRRTQIRHARPGFSDKGASDRGGALLDVTPGDPGSPSVPVRKSRDRGKGTMSDKLQTVNGVQFAVADLSLAEAGRHQMRLAEHEMPGLMAIRREYAEAQPLRGARVAGSLHMTVQT